MWVFWFLSFFCSSEFAFAFRFYFAVDTPCFSVTIPSNSAHSGLAPWRIKIMTGAH